VAANGSGSAVRASVVGLVAEDILVQQNRKLTAGVRVRVRADPAEDVLGKSKALEVIVLQGGVFDERRML
jgi:hypothetical protein